MFTLNTCNMVAQSTSKQEALRIRICQFRKTHQTFPKGFIVKHFSEEGVPRSTIYLVLQGNADFLNPKRKKGIGRIPKIMKEKAVRQLMVMLDHKDGVTQAQAARHFKCDQSFINKTLKRKTTIKYRRKKNIPDRNESQLQRIKPLCRYLYRNFRNIHYVPKHKNPPNVPETRPIEDFWAELKRRVYYRNWQAKTIPQLRNRVKYCLNKMDPEVPEVAKKYARQTPIRLGRITFNNVKEK